MTKRGTVTDQHTGKTRLINLPGHWQGTAGDLHQAAQAKLLTRLGSSHGHLQTARLPEILNKHSKTLHPKVHRGVLGIHEDPGTHGQDTETRHQPINMVVVKSTHF